MRHSNSVDTLQMLEIPGAEYRDYGKIYRFK
jgi:hypothetical protein